MSAQVEEVRLSLGHIELAAHLFGPEDGLPVIALHGWLDNANSFARLAPQLKGLRIVALDLAGHRVWIDEQSLELTAREFGLLSALAVRAERIVSRAQLVEALCDWGQDLTDNGLDIALHRLRRKLQPGGMGIRTVRGLGYMLEDAQDDSAP